MMKIVDWFITIDDVIDVDRSLIGSFMKR